jgi:hypothetical protein
VAEAAAEKGWHPKNGAWGAIKKGDEVVPLQTEDEFVAARGTFTKTNPLLKQALLQASEREARRTQETRQST